MSRLRDSIKAFTTREDPFAQPFRLVFEKALNRFFVRKFKVVPYFPQVIAIDATTLCNLRCEMCAVYTLPESRLGYMSFDNVKRILRQFPSHQMRALFLMGVGEPLLNPDSIKILGYAKKEGFITGLFTNGTLIDNKNVKALAKSVNWITFSVDGATKQTYESIRKGAVLANVIENITKFTKTCRVFNSVPKINLEFTVTEKNYFEITDIVELAHKLRVDGVSLSCCGIMTPFRDKEQYQLRNSALRNIDKKEIKQQFSRAMMLSRKLDINLTINSRKNRELNWPHCKWPWTGCCITHDGFVTPCCFEFNPERVNFGNLLEEPIKKIWNNDKYQAFRSQLMSRNPPDICCNCGI